MFYSPTGLIAPSLYPASLDLTGSGRKTDTMYPHYRDLYKNSAKSISFLSLLALIFIAIFAPHSSGVSTPKPNRPHSEASAPAPRDAFGRLPLSFELNQGQTDPRVKFLARGQGYGLFLSDNGAVFSFSKPAAALQLRLQGAATSPTVSGVDELPGKVNYLRGNEPNDWRTNIQTYARVRYEQIYPGVDLIYYGNQRQLEYDFVIQPGASPKQIRLAFDGAGKLRLNRHGDLILKSGARKITLLRPRAYQEVDKTGREVPARYLLKPRGQVAFQVGNYDKSRQLVIDPVLVYSTYLGGANQDIGNSIAVDSSGNAYIAGQTASLIFPTGSPLQAANGGGTDAFVAKLNTTGSALIYSTFLGGSNTDIASSIAIDNTGNAYITGQTSSTNFPVLNALHPTWSGSTDAFVAELNSSGSAFVYSTYLGGHSADIATSIAVDGVGSAYVTGSTASADFPTTNPLQANRSGNAIFKSSDSAGNWAPSNSGLLAAGVNDLTFQPGNSSIIYAATEAGVFKTLDGGGNWTALAGANFQITKLALDPTNSAIIYAATPGGLFKSIDGGNNFNAINNGFNTFARTILVDPVTPTTLYATAFGSSVFKSVDGGANWTGIFVFNAGLVNGLAIDPNTPTTLFAATSNGVFKSTDSAASWIPSNTGLPFSTNANGIVFDKTNNLLYTATNSGVFKSADGGNNWTSINGNLTFALATIVAIDPTNSSNIYIATPLGPQKTTDGGVTWNLSNNGYSGTTINSLVVNPTQPSTLYIGTLSGGDAFVTKLSAGGTSQLYSTYLGGSLSDAGNGIALDGAGNAYLTGSTVSSNFPTANALQPVKAFSVDAYVAKLNANGSALVYSTFLGGENNDAGRAIAVDSSGNAYIAGTTTSQSFPIVNAFQPSNAGFQNEGFVTKINAAGSALVYSTYLGGESDDECFAIAVDASGNAYVTGTTSSSNFPTLGALQPTRNGFSSDAFVTKLAPSGSSLIHSTYLGGSGSESGFGLALDSSQNIYIVGSTTSTNFPTVNPLQPSRAGSTDVFIAKLRPAPELEVTMTDSPDPVNFGSNLTYTISVKNNGEVAATGVTLTDTLPPGATLISATSSAGVCTGTTSINCGLGTVPPAATQTITIVVTSPAVRTIVNTAAITLNETDGFLANNTATVETLVDFTDLSMVKRAPQSLVTQGGQLTYSLIVKNKSGIPASATVTDNLPAGTSLIKCAATGTGVCGGNGNNVSVSFSQIAVGASEAILLTIQVSGSATEGTVITNTASVSSPIPDPDTSNNSAAASVTVAAVAVLQKSNGIVAFGSDRNFSGSTQPSGIYTVNVDGSDEKLFPNIPLQAGRPVWSPDGTKLAFQSTNFSGNSPGNEISIINADGTGLLKLANNVSDQNRSITWSPNGSQIAYIGAGGPSLDTIRTVHITNTDGSGTYRLPGSPSFISSVDWSPDGTRFVYSDEFEISVMNADGTGQTKLTTIQQTADGQTRDSDPRWSPDGRKILLTRSTINSNSIYTMNADGSNLAKLFNFGGQDAAWSGDGLAVVFQQGNEICRANVDGTNFKCLTNNGFYDFQPNWQRLPNANPTPTPTPAPSFTLSGRMTLSDGSPISLQVRLDGPASAIGGSDNTGNYTFINLPAGEYTLTPLSIFHSFNPASRTVTITNANIAGLDFVATFEPANITGHVKDNNGNPLAGIKITSVGGFPQGSTFTDANGFYSFPNVARNRTYSIFPDPFTPYVFVPDAKVISNLTASEVVDFAGTKQPTNVIAGRVVERITGQGISGILVELAQDSAAAAFVFTDANGNFNFGERKSNHSFSVFFEDNQTYIFEPKTNPPLAFAEIKIPSLTTDQNLVFAGTRRNTLQFSVASPSVSEGSGSAEIIVTRAGDLTSPATVAFATTDAAGLVACNVINGKASERCDYGTTAGTLRFAAGEASKSFFIPVVDDVHVEGNETFTIALAGAVGATLGSPATVTVTITDNDANPATQNPIDGVQPFVTQQYIDFLGRLPDTIGLANWMATLGGCPNGGFGENDNPDCDRVHVSAGFFLSDEFRGRGYWAYRFYEVGFDRRPLYVEFVPDMAQVGGAQSPASELLSKATYTDAFVQRSEFTSRYNGLTNAAYVNALEQNAEITLNDKAALIAALDGNQKTRAQVLREIVESKAVEDRFFIRAFVAMQYFGYLRRDPDTIGYSNWVTTLTADPGNFRHMIFGFLFSIEYRGRFGPQ
jgi:uncharacterized repeat protein (TIGR01451 family)